MDDRRTKGLLLATGYRAIPLDGADPLTKDFATFFQKREEYKAALSDDDRALLKRTLEASMTPTEKRYALAQETLRPYWEQKTKLYKKYSAFQKLQQQYEELDADNSMLGELKKRALTSTDAWKLKSEMETAVNQAMRLKYPAIDEALVTWYPERYPTPIKTQLALKR